MLFCTYHMFGGGQRKGAISEDGDNTTFLGVLSLAWERYPTPE